MKRIFFSIFLVGFLVVGLSSQSWAMGKRGGSGSGSGHHFSHGSGSGSYSDDNSHFGSHKFSSHHFGTDENEGEEGDTNNNEEQDSAPRGFMTSSESEDENFPVAATVPEPTTMALLGMGLTGILLRRKKR